MRKKINRIFDAWDVDPKSLQATIERARSTVGENLHAMRVGRCVKIIGVENATGMPSARISKIEKGKLVRLTLTDLFTLAEYYNVRVSMLFAKKRERKKSL